jgi:outer membrane protein assembly factor BamB
LKRLFFYVILIVMIGFPSFSVVKLTVSAQTPNTDWSMWMHDPQHSGVTEATFSPVLGTNNCQAAGGHSGVSPCMQPQWKKSFSEWTSGYAQPIVVGSSVFLTNMNGNLYAYDADTGAEQWVFSAAAGIYVTPAAAEGKIFFGDLSGKFYAVNAADGTEAFSYQTDDRIMSSPTLTEENGTLKVFIGSNDGTMYAFDGRTGAVLFAYNLPTRTNIVSNPAFYDGKVFFAAEDMHAYAINSSTGALVWRVLLNGELNRHDHPVVLPASNTVLFYTVPRYGNQGWGLKDRYYTYKLLGGHGTPDGSPEWDFPTLLTAVQTEMLALPHTKAMYLLDTNTGSEITNFTVGGQALQMIPVNLWYSNGNNYPLAMNQKDLYIQGASALIKVDTVTREISLVLDYQFVRGDEFSPVTIADNWMYGGYSSAIARVNVATTQFQQLLRSSYPPDDEPLDPIPSAYHWEGNTGDGGTNAGQHVIVASGRAFYFTSGWFYAF